MGIVARLSPVGEWLIFDKPLHAADRAVGKAHFGAARVIRDRGQNILNDALGIVPRAVILLFYDPNGHAWLYGAPRRRGGIVRSGIPHMVCILAETEKSGTPVPFPAVVLFSNMLKRPRRTKAKTKKRRIAYFDHAATTPLDPRVLAAMKPHFLDGFGNPANLYALGRSAKYAILGAREKIDAALNCGPQEFIFTGSATESDNIALQGIARANKDFGNKIIISNVEHKGILAVTEHLAKEGFEIVELPVGPDALVRPVDLERALDEKTILVSITSADSETGSLQPIPELASIIKAWRAARAGALPYFHTDASQAATYADLNVETLGVDLMTLSAHKIHGPKGVGGLYARRGVRVAPIIFGGGQQGRLRSGTENVPGIVGFGEAMALAQKERAREAARVKKLRDRLEKGIMKNIPKVLLNGHPTKRLPNFFNVSILDIEGEAMLLYLDEKGILVNTGSACNSESLEPSAVLVALGRPYEFVHGSIRFTLGKSTTKDEVDHVLKELPGIVRVLRRVSPLNLNLDQSASVSQPKAFVGGQTPHFLRKKK